MVIGLKPLTIFAKRSILVDWQGRVGSKYASAYAGSLKVSKTARITLRRGISIPISVKKKYV